MCDDIRINIDVDINIAQAQRLQDALEKSGRPALDAAVFLDAPED